MQTCAEYVNKLYDLYDTYCEHGTSILIGDINVITMRDMEDIC